LKSQPEGCGHSLFKEMSQGLKEPSPDFPGILWPEHFMQKAWGFLPKIFVEKFNKQGILVAEVRIWFLRRENETHEANRI